LLALHSKNTHMKKNYLNPPFSAKILLLVVLLAVGYMSNKRIDTSKSDVLSAKTASVTNYLQ